MNLLLAPDSFKESLSVFAVAAALAEGWRRGDPDAVVDIAPLSDGGDGLLAVLLHADPRGERRTVLVKGPLGEAVEADFGLVDGGSTAIIEMAQASGLALISPERRDPRRAGTYGTGQLIRAALDAGARHLLIGLGGSATNDAGAGMARALGVVFQDASGAPLPEGGAALADLAAIDFSGLDPRIAESRILALCDVKNPMIGPEGASAVYGPQKGATPAQVRQLDAALARFADIVAGQTGCRLHELPGSGAAGGLAGGIVALLGGRILPGFDTIAEQLALAARIGNADLVVTGEGAMDGQSLQGKVVGGVLRLARAADVPVIALAGRLGPGYRDLLDAGLTAAFALADGPISPEGSMARTRELLIDRAEGLARYWRAAEKGLSKNTRR